MDKPTEIPEVVIDAINKAFPEVAKDIISNLKWNHDHYFFEKWGMYVGVEVDGYIHT